MNALSLVGRILFVAIFLMSGLMGHLVDAGGTVAYAASMGLPMANLLVPLSGLLMVAGGLMILLGFKPRLGAWLLFLFLVPTTFVMHRFWGLQDPQMVQMQMTHFMKNLSLIGATLLLQFTDRWPMSIKP